MTILDEIVAVKRKHVETCKSISGIQDLERKAFFGRTPVSLKQRLLQPDSSGIIAEFKRKSPSKGVINDRYAPEEITAAYQEAGVAGVSILTDEPFFGGTNQDLESARNTLKIPILRKDFIVDEYQVIEAKAIGADLILLIAAILTKEQVRNFSGLARSLGMEILFEVHDRHELEKVIPEVTCIGVNNRNLKTFAVDIQQSVELAKMIPVDFVKVSESGISETGTMKMLKNHGYKGFLIGENFMKTADPGEACREFIAGL